MKFRKVAIASSCKMVLLNICTLSILAHALLVVGESGGQQKYLPGYKECMEIHNISLVDLKVPKEDDKLNCFFKCLLERRGKIKSDGTLDEEALDDSFSKFTEHVRENIKACLKEVGKIVECADIPKFRNCFREAVF